MFTKFCYLFLFLDTKKKLISYLRLELGEGQWNAGRSDVLYVQACVDIKSASSLEPICSRNQDHRMEGAWKLESPL